MIPSLKDLHEQKIEQLLIENKDAVELLKEAIDQKTIDEIEKALNKLTNIMNATKLDNLDSFHLGVQKAHKEMASLLSQGSIRNWISSFIPTGFSAIGRLTAFTTGVTKLMKQLPTIVRVVKGSMDSERRAQWDPNKPIDQLLDSASTQKLIDIIIKAMEPAEGLASISTGLPYVNDKTAAAELLSLSYNELNKFSIAAQEVANDALRIKTRQIGDDINAVIKPKIAIGKNDGSKNAEADAEAEAESEHETDHLIMPVSKQKVNSQQQSSVNAPTVREMFKDLQEVYDETLFNLMGTRGERSKNFQDFKRDFIKNFVTLMIQKNQLKPPK